MKSHILDQLDLIDTYKIPLKTEEYILFKGTWNTLQDRSHHHKTSHKKFQRIEIILSIFSDHNDIKLKINYRKKNGQNMNTWTLKKTLLKNPMGKRRNKGGNLKIS